MMEYPFVLDHKTVDGVSETIRQSRPKQSTASAFNSTPPATYVQPVVDRVPYIPPSSVADPDERERVVRERKKYREQVRGLRSTSYVIVQEALRANLPGQAQLNAYNNLLEHELSDIVREQNQPIQVHSITNLNNVAVTVTFTDISIRAPVHREPDDTWVRLRPCDVGKRRIPYDVSVSVDLKLVQTRFRTVPPLRNYRRGPVFYAPCLIVNDPYDGFDGWGLAVGRATTGDPRHHARSGQRLFFRPGVWDAFHIDACQRQNRRARQSTTPDALKRHMWTNLSTMDQRVWDAHNAAVSETASTPCKGMACVKLLVFIGSFNTETGVFEVSKMGKRTIFDSYGDVMATLPPYIEQSQELRLGSTTEYVYGIPFIKLPCMLGSNFCHTVREGFAPPRFDSGIILTGTCDKVVIMQQQLGCNRVFMFNQRAKQVLAEVRSAHIGKRRSTSALRVVINPRDGVYVLLPFLKRGSGTDVHVHIVDFIRLLWEFDPIHDPEVGLSFATTVQLFRLLSGGVLCGRKNDVTETSKQKTRVPYLRCAGHILAFLKTHHVMKTLSKKLRLQILIASATETEERDMFPFGRCPLERARLSSQRRNAPTKRRKGRPAAHTAQIKELDASRDSVSAGAALQGVNTPHARQVFTSTQRVFRNILTLLGRRTVQTLDAVVSVLTLSFFGANTKTLGIEDDGLKRYLEIRELVQKTTEPAQFTRSVTDILTALALEGARERTLAAQKSYVLHNVLRSEFCPHLGTDRSVATRRRKLFYTVSMLFAPLFDLYSGREKFPSDKDALGNKRIDLFDEIIGTCFRQQAQSNRGTLAKLIQSEANAGVHVDSILIHRVIANKRFDNSLRYCFNTGRTKLSEKRPGAKNAGQNGSGGVQQTSGNAMARISHLRRVRHAHINPDNRAVKPRMVHQKDTRRFCVGESPEGTNCGLLKNLALLTHVTIGCVDTDDLAALVHCILPPDWIRLMDDFPWDVNCVLLVNGVIKAYIFPNKIKEACHLLRLARRSNNIDREVTIYLARRGMVLCLDSNPGRVLDPLIITEALTSGRFAKVCKASLQVGGVDNLFESLLTYGCMEYVCANEESHCWVAPSWASWFAQLKQGEYMYTHLMVHGMAIFDYAIASMVFPEANQGPRNTYQAKMVTQAVSMLNTTHQSSTDTTKFYLNYGQAPVVESVVQTMTNLRTQNHGLNAVTAILRTSTNMEDAIVINQSAIERGMFHMTYSYDLFVEAEKKQKIQVPNVDTCRNLKQANYSKLDPKTGIVRVNTNVEFNDVLVGLTSEVTDFKSNSSIDIDVSLIYTKKIPGRVTAITTTTNRYGEPLVNIRILTTNEFAKFPYEIFGKKNGQIVRDRRGGSGGGSGDARTSQPRVDDRRTSVCKSFGSLSNWPPGSRIVSARGGGISAPQLGDKFASRSAQKGVIGSIVPESDMPFVASGPNRGMRPDIIVSPDALPSRMTIGSPVLEQMLGVIGAVLGKQIDGSPFSTENLDPAELGDLLQSIGQNRYCEETMRSGVTGELINGEDHLPAHARRDRHSSQQRRGVSMGIVYYQRLAHFVAAKIHSRNGGQQNEATRQPSHGRAKNGGFRLGSMEVDCIIAHGASDMLRERMLLASDNHYAPVCRMCRLLAETSRENKPYCQHCGMHDTCETVQLPYTTSFMMHLFQTAHQPWRLEIGPGEVQ